ncbi:MAG: PfkB family carbohydrate kinase [Sediminibacterium sp.]
MLSIIGGTYYEICNSPVRCELRGSGLRAAAALSDHIPGIKFISCIGKANSAEADYECGLFDIDTAYTQIPETIYFDYLHPLSQPYFFPQISDQEKIRLESVKDDCVLYYGMIEAQVPVIAKWLVYDPQNGEPLDPGVKADHLALVLNWAEAKRLSGLTDQEIIEHVGKRLLEKYAADTVIIKNGVRGAWIFEPDGMHHIPAFKTSSVWAIGSGDIFSAAFAWQWAVQKKTPQEAGLLASQFTAHYCETRDLPLPAEPDEHTAVVPTTRKKKVYLAGPFFSTAEIWLINELRYLLMDFGNEVFSPFHDVGTETTDQIIAELDINGLAESDIVMAVVTGLDAGTLFEVGYAKAIGKPIIALVENVSEENLLMLNGTGCDICYDIASAIYKASW